MSDVVFWLRVANGALSLACVVAYATSVAYRWPQMERHDKYTRLSLAFLLASLTWSSALLAYETAPVVALSTVTFALVLLLGALFNMARCEVRRRLR